MHADWKWTGDRGERRLADGRGLQVQCGAPVDDTDPEYWIAAIVMPDGVEFLLSSTGASTREAAVEAVERAAGVYVEPAQVGIRMVADIAARVGDSQCPHAAASAEPVACVLPDVHSGTRWAGGLCPCADDAAAGVPYEPEQYAHADGGIYLSGPPVGTQEVLVDPPQTALQAAVERAGAAAVADGTFGEPARDRGHETLLRALQACGSECDALREEVDGLRGRLGEIEGIAKEIEAERDALRAEVERLTVWQTTGRGGQNCTVEMDNGLPCGMLYPCKRHPAPAALRAEVDRLTRELAAVTDERNDFKAQRDAMRADVPDSERLLGSVAMTGMIQAHDAHKKWKRAESEAAELRAELATLRRTVAEECAKACEAQNFYGLTDEQRRAYPAACRAIGGAK